MLLRSSLIAGMGLVFLAYLLLLLSAITIVAVFPDHKLSYSSTAKKGPIITHRIRFYHLCFLHNLIVYCYAVSTEKNGTHCIKTKAEFTQ